MSMFTIILLLSSLSTKTISIPTSAFSDTSFTGNETDHHALLALKSKITHDPHGVLNSWNDSAHFCLWEGVTCGRLHKRVIALNLTEKGLVGTLSPSIGNLSFLHDLLLVNNTFRGYIPSEVGQLFRLQTLVLQGNAFEGEIPANISGCLRLKNLYLSHNKLVGKIPPELSLLSKLISLSIDNNNLTGDLSAVANLTSVQILSLADQIYQGGLGFHGKIPNFMGKFKDLIGLGLGGNSLTGKIPLSLYNLSKLQFFSLAGNQLEGSLPPDLGFYFPQLKSLQIGDNQLSGPIPYSLSNLSNLEELDIAPNNFQGKFLFDGRNMRNLTYLVIIAANLGTGEADDLNFLDTLVNCSHLQTLAIGHNNFGGNLPHYIANLSTKVRVLDFENNQILGRIPSGLSNLVNLQYLFLNDNQLTGKITDDLGKIPLLQYAKLSDNQLTGRIPSSLGNLSWLSKLNLSNNKFQGKVPTSLGKCKSLLYLYLNQNNLVGNIPHQLFQASSLVKLDLGQNHLQGSIPPEIGNLQNLVHVNLSNNNFSGSLPISLDKCVSLTELYLDSNSFIGFIPPSFSLLKDVQEIDLSGNKFSGGVPKYFSNFSSLEWLNLSFNNFEGEVPTKGVFANLSAISVVGNTKLCGGIAQLKLPSCPKPIMKSQHKKKLSAIVIASASISSVLVGLSILSSVYLLCSKRKRAVSSTGISFKEPFVKVSYDMLLKATEGFSPRNLIGSGSFGSVYKGTLLLEGIEKVVAVKVINNQKRGADKSFMAECEALRIIRHRNLVGVITACSSIDFQGNVFKALVYELISKGSLERWLYSNPKDDDQQENLSLQQRLNIAIDVAHALDYIHNGNDPPIVHCDLKPSNILLDEDLTAHVGDFGLVKLIPEFSEQLHNSSSVGVRGTIGYTAPEYGLGASVSTVGDVYSYGIVLLEMMTAKKPSDLMFEGDVSLHKFADSASPDRVLEIIDPKLKVFDEEEGNMDLNDTRACITKCIFECITSIVTIGVRCSNELPQERMDIKDVIHQLQYQRNQLLLCRRQHRCQHIYLRKMQ